MFLYSDYSLDETMFFVKDSIYRSTLRKELDKIIPFEKTEYGEMKKYFLSSYELNDEVFYEIKFIERKKRPKYKKYPSTIFESKCKNEVEEKFIDKIEFIYDFDIPIFKEFSDAEEYLESINNL